MRFSICAFFALALAFAAERPDHKTQNIIFVMSDGLRWQDVFRGADASLMNLEMGGVKEADVPALKQTYWRESADERRQILMPFVWGTLAKNGQIFGNRDKGSDAYVTNGLNFSYPGYSETLCGFPDPRVKSNDKIPNPNATVLEWLNSMAAFHNRIAAFGAWDVFSSIFNAQRAGFVVNDGYEPLEVLAKLPRVDLLNQLKKDSPRIWPDEAFDPIPFYTALEYLRARHPRVLYLSLGETDDWAHAGNYAEYLIAAHRADEYLGRLWKEVQSMPQYRGKTTILFSPDHGRGEKLAWKDHGEKVPDSKYIWLAAMGPDTSALGERTNVPAITQSQIAATIAALLGEDYNAAVPKAGKPVSDIVHH